MTFQIRFQFIEINLALLNLVIINKITNFVKKILKKNHNFKNRRNLCNEFFK